MFQIDQIYSPSTVVCAIASCVLKCEISEVHPGDRRLGAFTHGTNGDTTLVGTYMKKTVANLVKLCASATFAASLVGAASVAKSPNNDGQSKDLAALAKPIDRFSNHERSQQGGIIEIPGESTFVQWAPSYNDALNAAKRNHKLLFIYFSGSNWCSLCTKFDEQVLSDSKFITKVEPNFSFYNADFPRGDQGDLMLHEENQNLVKRFDVDGFPTIVILDWNETELARFHSEDMTPEDFANRLLAIEPAR